jgi:hypothetical protein
MRNSTVSSTAFKAKAAAKEALSVASLIESMIYFVKLSSSLSFRYLFVEMSYSTHPRPIRKTGFVLFIICSLLTMVLAATDCEILNSGIPSISSAACCNEVEGIYCSSGRVTKM